MIRERVETEQFVLEVTLEPKDPRMNATYYKDCIKTTIPLIVAGLSSEELFPLFTEELMKIADNMLHVIQTERALKGKDDTTANDD